MRRVERDDRHVARNTGVERVASSAVVKVFEISDTQGRNKGQERKNKLGGALAESALGNMKSTES